MTYLSGMIDIVSKAADNAGGVVKLAALLGIKHPSLYSWDRVPAERALDIARIANVLPHEVRPDIYPTPADEVSK